VTVNKLRFRHPIWLFGTLALILTAPVIAGEVIAHREQAAGAPPSGQSTVANPNTAPAKPAQAGPPAEGQRGGGRPDPLTEWEWWNDAAVKKELGLTEAKSKEIDRIFQDRLRHAKPFYDEYMTQRDEQNRMAKERLVDEGTFALQVARVDALRAELLKSRAIMFYRISRKLTADQNKKLEEIRDRRRGEGRGRGTGTR
jgi:Spy/CpxP family protein refolding chaperone